MPVTLLDLLVIGVVLISAVLAMVRGFTREVLAIGAWLAAAAAGLMFRGLLLPFAQKYIKHDLVANIASGGVIFLITLIIVSFITIRISDMILDSRIGAVDRALGFVFGVARGLLLATIAFIFVNWAVPEQSQSNWIKDAKSRELLASGGKLVLSALPNDPNNALLKALRVNNLLPAAPAPDGDTQAPANDQSEPADPGQ